MNDTVRSFVEAEKQAGRNVAKACELLEVSRSASRAGYGSGGNGWPG